MSEVTTTAVHTPGPWTANDHANMSEGSTATTIKAAALGDVAQAYGWGDADLSQANANLIAAAPDLLAALKIATEHEPQRYSAGHPDSTERLEWQQWKAARAAIDKAEGR